MITSGAKAARHCSCLAQSAGNTSPPHPATRRGSIGSSCFGCARYDLRSKERSRLSVPLSQYAPNDSARVGEGRSGHRGRVLSQSHTVAWERRRREPGYNPVIDTTTLTSGEGHVVEDGISQRVRKILAGVPASVVIRDQILALSFSRSKRQHWTVGNRPIRNYDLRSLHRNSVEAQIQDRSRQKTGLNTVPGFSRVYPSSVIPADAGTQRKTKHALFLPFAERRGRVRSTQGMPEIHHPRAVTSQPNVSRDPSFPRTTPSFPRTREPREKQSTPFSSPSRSEGDACAARRGCPKFTTPDHPQGRHNAGQSKEHFIALSDCTFTAWHRSDPLHTPSIDPKFRAVPHCLASIYRTLQPLHSHFA